MPRNAAQNPALNTRKRWCPPAPRQPIATIHPSDLGAVDKAGKPIHAVIMWRDRIVGPDGPMMSNTRLVLLTLAVHMDDRGYAFPSVELLTLECGLSQSAVKQHLALAASEGWIKRTEGMGYKQGWRKYEYEAAIPVYEGGLTVRPRSAWREVRTANHRGRKPREVVVL